ncbi:MAG: hypothetical protein ACK55I_33395, partial [bacterium]
MRRRIPLRDDADRAGPTACQALKALGGKRHLHVIAVVRDPRVNDPVRERPALRIDTLVVAYRPVE